MELKKTLKCVVGTTLCDINAGYTFQSRNDIASIFPEDFKDRIKKLQGHRKLTLSQCWDEIVPYDPLFPVGWLRDMLEDVTKDMATYESRKVEISLTVKVLDE